MIFCLIGARHALLGKRGIQFAGTMIELTMSVWFEPEIKFIKKAEG